MKQPKITNFFIPIIINKNYGIGKNIKQIKPKVLKPKVLKPKVLKHKILKPKIIKPKILKPKLKKPKTIKKMLIDDSDGYLGDSEDENYLKNIKIIDLVNEIKYLKVNSI